MSGTQSFGLSASLQIQGNYQTVLRQLGSSLTRLDRQITGLETKVGLLAKSFVPLAGAATIASRAATTEMAALRAAVTGVSTSVQGATRSLGSNAAALNRTATAADKVRQNVASAGQALRNLSAVQVPTLVRGGRAGAGGAVAAAAAASSGTSDTGKPLWRRMLDTGAMGAAGAAGLVSPGAVLGGGAAYGAFRLGQKTVQEGGKLQQETTVGRAQVSDPAWLAQLRERAIAVTKEVPGTTPAENIRAGLELRTAIPDAQEALKLLGPLQGIVAALRSLEPGSGRADRASADLARALNLRGAAGDLNDSSKQDYARLQREAELMGRNMIAFRNMDPREWVNYFQQARVAGQQASQDQLYGGFTASGIQAMGGMRFGTGQAGFVRQFANGIMTEKTAEQLKRLGLITKNARAARVTNAELDAEVSAGRLTQEEADQLRAGNAQKFARENMFRADLAVSDQEAWRRAVTDMLKKRGINLDNPRTADAFSQQQGSTSVVRGYLSWLLDPQGRMADIQAVRGMPPDVLNVLREGYNASLANMTAGFNTLLQTIGESGEVVRLMNDLGAAFRNMQESVRQGSLDDFIKEGRTRWETTQREFKAASDFIRAEIDHVREVMDRLPDSASRARDGLSRLIDSIATLPERLPDMARRLFSPGALAPAPGSPGATPNPDAVPMPPSWGGPIPRRDGVIPQRYTPPTAPPASIIPAGWTPQPPVQQEVVVQTPIYLDSRVLATAVTRIQSREVNRPEAGPNFYDRRLGGLGASVVTT